MAYAVAGVYLLALGVMLRRHEPWFDEAQAWLLARDTNPWSLMAEHLRYEGSPGLWHLLLMVPAKLGLPYLTLNLISVLLAGLGAFAFVRYSPFPPLVKAVFPFTYFVFYQYGVVARSYALLAPLLFALAHLYPRRVERAGLFTLLLCLLANVSAHGLLIAASIMAVHLLDVARRRRVLGSAVLRRQVGAVTVFGTVCLLVVLQLLPRHDLTFAPHTDLSLGRLGDTVATLLPGSLTGSVVSSSLVLVMSAWWFGRSRHLLLWLLPTTAIVVFSAVRYSNVWHQGSLFLVWIFALWVTLEAGAGRSRVDRWSRAAAVAAIALVLAVQLSWSLRSFRFDYSNPYSGSRALAHYLKDDDLQDSVIYGTGFPSFAVLPYFDRNIFANYNGGSRPAFWFWSTRNTIVEDPSAIVRARPELVVLSVKLRGSRDAPSLFPGYRIRAEFPGTVWFKDRALEADGYILLERE